MVSPASLLIVYSTLRWLATVVALLVIPDEEERHRPSLDHGGRCGTVGTGQQSEFAVAVRPGHHDFVGNVANVNTAPPTPIPP